MATCDLTPAQREALVAMRASFASIDGRGLPMDDKTFLRYLRARKFNVENAKSMLNETIKWRIDFDIKSIHDGWQNIIKEENSTGKGYCRGFSKEGNVLLYLRPEHENTHNHEGNLKHLVYNMERAVACMDSDGKGAEKLILLIDYHGYSLLNAPPMRTSTETLSILQNHYPERLFRAYCIRPPWIFNAFWTMISPFIDPITLKKIQMISGSTAEIGKRLAADGIELSQLESSIGGEDARPFLSHVYLGQPPAPLSRDTFDAPLPSCASASSGASGNATFGSGSGSEIDRDANDYLSLASTLSRVEFFGMDYNKLARGVLETEAIEGRTKGSVWTFWR